MTIDEAKFVLQWNSDPKKLMWHPDTEEALEWAIAEVERLQKANDDLVSEGPRIFSIGTPIAGLPEIRNMRGKPTIPEEELQVRAYTGGAAPYSSITYQNQAEKSND